MMATEATVGGPVDVSSNNPSLNQPIETKSDFQNVDRPYVTVNGSADEQIAEIVDGLVDGLVHSVEASISGGSDTEASKSDPSKLTHDTGHARSSSAVKKPISFKSVSVNRTFLASKGASHSTSRPESAAGSISTTPQPSHSLSASKLKLVAKSGSSLGGASKALGANGKPSGAPDPSLVWNRNKAPIQPEAKKRSDEELKKDGIHISDRLGPGDLKGQSNWADIEDDDEEWAPETITWTDGTKITLPHPEEAPPSPAVQPAPVAKVNKDPIPVPKPKSPAPIPGPSSAPVLPISNATGSPSVKPGILASGKGLIFKGAPEKPTLVAKPPAPPGPVKSPWAPLPPVEKVSPVVMELQGQTLPSRYQLHDVSNIKNATPPPATKEIAADDFSRNYRDGPMNPSRELYNSQSGRYEPVSDRRGSRNDIHARQPALLQRPAHNEQQGPAEPSAAFQTSRSSAQEAPYGRRRGSSNVSGGSGHLAPRIGKPQDMPLPQEPPLHQAQAQALQPQAGLMTGSAGSSSSLPQRFPTANTMSNQRAYPPQPYQQPLVSPYQSHAVPYQNIPQHDPNLEQNQREFMKKKREEAIRRRMEREAQEEAEKEARIAEKLKALGPAPERKSAKKDAPSVVHRTDVPSSLAAQPKPTSGTAVTEESVPVAGPSSETKIEMPPAKDIVPKDFHAEPDLRLINGPGKHPMDYEQPRMASTQQLVGPNIQTTGPWSEPPPQQPDRFQTWTNTHQNTSRNVWGAPGNDRSLGNGTFNADIGPLADSHVTTSASTIHRPAPIAPPRSAQAPQPEAQLNRLAPIGPPRAQPTAGNTWKSFDLKADDERRRLERIKQNSVLEENTVAITDKWRAVDLRDGERTSIGTFVKSHKDTTVELQDAEKAISFSPSAAPPTGPSAQTRSGSRFFPASKDIQHEAPMQPSTRSKSPTPPPPTADGHPVYDGDVTKPHVALPPLRPRVKLPPSAQPISPGPIAPPSKEAPVSFAEAASSNVLPRPPEANTSGRPVSRGRGFNGIPQKPHEIASQENWQSKINSLMGKTSTSPAKSIHAGSSMMVPVEFPRSHESMDVPILSPSGTDSSDSSSFTSKEMAEECFGEQEMGSLPTVHLPAETPDAAWQAVPPNWQPVPYKLRVNPTGCEPFKFGVDYANGKSVIRVSTPGMSEARTVVAPVIDTRSVSNPRRTGPRGGGPRHPSRGGRRGGRDSLEHTGEHGSTSTASRNVSGRVPRSYRPRGETWSRQGSSASVTQS